MGDMYENFGNAIAQGIYSIADAKQKKKDMESEYAQRLKLLQEQQRLEAEAPTAEMKLMRMYQQNPQQFQQFRQAMDPLGPQELALRQGQLGLQQQQFQHNAANQNYANQMDYWKAQRQNWQDQYGTGSPTNRQRDFQFLMQMPGMTQEKALQYLYRPDLMSQMMMMGGMGGIGGGLPGGGGLNYGQ